MSRSEGLATLAPVAAVIGSLISLTVGASFAKQLFPVLGPEGTSTLRVGFAAILLLAYWRPWRRPLALRDAGVIALYGAILGLMNLLFYASLKTIPLGVAIAIEFTGPLAVAILGSRRALDFAWIALAGLGLALLLPVTQHAASLDPRGVAYALGAGVCWALYILVGERAGRIHAGQATSIGMLVACLVVAPFGWAHAGTALFDPSLWPLGVGIAVLSSVIPYSLEMVALTRLPKATFGILLSMEPACGALAALAILGERLTTVQGLAIACIILASAGSTMSVKQAAPAC